MALRFNDTPPDVAGAVAQALKGKLTQAQLARVAPSLGGGQRGAAPELETMAPHPVEVLDLDDLRAGGGLAAARRVATRVLVREGGRVLASAQVAPPPRGGGPPRAATVHTGPAVDAVERAIEEVARRHQTGDMEVNVSLLEVPALRVAALVVRDPTGAPIEAVPLATSPGWLDADVAMPAGAFEAVLRDRANATPVFDSSPRPTR